MGLWGTPRGMLRKHIASPLPSNERRPACHGQSFLAGDKRAVLRGRWRNKMMLEESCAEVD